jgi:hypothetical protein
MVQMKVGNSIEQGLRKLEKVIIARLNSFVQGTPYINTVLDAYEWTGMLQSILPAKKISFDLKKPVAEPFDNDKIIRICLCTLL